MLEKHLGHLKKPVPGMEHIVPGISSGHSQSLKDEESPGNSPATMSTWNSPGGQLTGASPIVSALPGDYMSSVRGASNDAYAMPDYSTSPQNMAMRVSGAPRRAISDITGGEDLAANVKRQQMFAQPLAPQQRK